MNYLDIAKNKALISRALEIIITPLSSHPREKESNPQVFEDRKKRCQHFLFFFF
jgi:hypothetical protein